MFMKMIILNKVVVKITCGYDLIKFNVSKNDLYSPWKSTDLQTAMKHFLETIKIARCF